MVIYTAVGRADEVREVAFAENPNSVPEDESGIAAMAEEEIPVAFRDCGSYI
jgi:hypothetical protein